MLALVAAPAAAPVRGHAASVTLSKASFTTRWHESHFLSGKLVLKGKATGAATVQVGWFAASLLSQQKPRYGASGPQTVKVSVKRGTFKKAIKFRTTYYPGKFVLAGYASGSSGLVSLPGRTVKMPAPIEGVVVKATGHSSGRAGLFAKFVFAPGALPKSHKVATTWFDPGGRAFKGALGAAQTVNSNVKAKGKPLSVGFWRCLLASSGRPIAEVSVRVG